MNKTIAIIDDEQSILDMLNKFLTRSGKFDIVTFSNPQIALSEVKQGKFDLILLDIMMPTLNGIDFLKDLNKTTSDTKIIMMTAFSTQDKMIECNKLGANDYITKPFISLRDVDNKILDNLGL